MSLTISTNSPPSYAGFNSPRNPTSLQQSLSRLLSGRRNFRTNDDSSGLSVSIRHGNPINRLTDGYGKIRNDNFFLQSPHAIRSQANMSSSVVLMLTH